MVVVSLADERVMIVTEVVVVSIVTGVKAVVVDTVFGVVGVVVDVVDFDFVVAGEVKAVADVAVLLD